MKLERGINHTNSASATMQAWGFEGNRGLTYSAAIPLDALQLVARYMRDVQLPVAKQA